MFESIKTFFQNNRGTIIILGIFVFCGGFLRLYNLGEQSLWIDEGYTINASQGIVEYGYPLLDSGKTYDAHKLHNYITAGSMKLFGFDAQNPWSARLPAALFGILSILAVFFFTKRVTSSLFTSLSASFLMTFSYWEIAWSRQARGYADMQFFILLSFAFFYSWLENKKIINGLLAILFLVLSYFSHGVALIFIPAYFVIFIIHGISSGKIKEWLSFSTIGFLVILGVFGTWILYRILPSIVTYSYVDNYVSFLSGDLKYISLAVIFVLFGLFFGKKIFWKSVYLIGIILPTIIIVIFYSQVIQTRYLLAIFPFLLITGAYGLYLIVYKKEYIKPEYKMILYFIIIGAVAFTTSTFIPQSIYNLESGSPQPNFKKAYTIINNLKKNGDVIISPYTHLSKIYLDDKGLWLPISLTGRTSEITANTINGGDYYTGAPIIPDQTALENILNTMHGYIVIDSMAKVRLKGLLTAIINHPRVTLLYDNKSATNDVVAVYSFGI